MHGRGERGRETRSGRGGEVSSLIDGRFWGRLWPLEAPRLLRRGTVDRIEMPVGIGRDLGLQPIPTSAAPFLLRRAGREVHGASAT